MIRGDLDLRRARYEPGYLRRAKAFLEPISDVQRAYVAADAPADSAGQHQPEPSHSPDGA